MAHMQPVVDRFHAFVVETSAGTEVVPEDLLSLHEVDSSDESTDGQDPAILAALIPYCEGEPESYSKAFGWFARLSAPGHMDCTPWTGPFKTDREADAALREQYEIDEDGESL